MALSYAGFLEAFSGDSHCQSDGRKIGDSWGAAGNSCVIDKRPFSRYLCKGPFVVNRAEET